MAHPVVTALKKATRGLFYMSEKDAPYKAFAWDETGPISAKKVLAASGAAADAKVEEIPFDKFMAYQCREEKWHGAEEKAVAKRYADLNKVLQDNLTDLTLFKIGDGKLRVFIVGRTSDGKWAGLETEALET